MSPNRHNHAFQWSDELEKLVRQAMKEDVGVGDVTAKATIGARQVGTAGLYAKAEGVFCGRPLAKRIFKMADKDCVGKWSVEDGDTVTPGQQLAGFEGKLRGLITAERLALNFMQRLSGIATLTGKIVEAAGGTHGPLICDTRKTTPLWRALERYAVRCGGGTNHRFGLFDMILIKENHVRAAGGLDLAIRKSRAKYPDLRVGAEATNEKEVAICCEEKVDLILLDNFKPAQAARVIEKYRVTGIPFEISGGVTLKNVQRYAAARPDRISVGALTHSAVALDLSLLIDNVD